MASANDTSKVPPSRVSNCQLSSMIDDALGDGGVNQQTHPVVCYLIEMIKCKASSEREKLTESVQQLHLELLCDTFIITFLRDMNLGNSEEKFNRLFHDMSNQVTASVILSKMSPQENVMLQSELKKFLSGNGQKLMGCQRDIKDLLSRYILKIESEFITHCQKLPESIVANSELTKLNSFSDAVKLSCDATKSEHRLCESNLKFEEAKCVYLETFLKLLNVFDEYVSRYQLGENVSYEGAVIRTSQRISEVIALRSKLHELEYMVKIYQAHVVNVLREKRRMMDEEEVRLDAALTDARGKLYAYGAAGDKFKSLAQQYTSLESKIDAMSWALNQ